MKAKEWTIQDNIELGSAQTAAFDAQRACLKAISLLFDLSHDCAEDGAAWKEWATCELDHATACLQLAKKWLEEADV